MGLHVRVKRLVHISGYGKREEGDVGLIYDVDIWLSSLIAYNVL